MPRVAPVVLVSQGIVVVPQNEQYVIQRFGRFSQTLDPGLNLLVPFIDQIACEWSTAPPTPAGPPFFARRPLPPCHLCLGQPPLPPTPPRPRGVWPRHRLSSAPLAAWDLCNGRRDLHWTLPNTAATSAACRPLDLLSTLPPSLVESILLQTCLHSDGGSTEAIGNFAATCTTNALTVAESRPLWKAVLTHRFTTEFAERVLQKHDDINHAEHAPTADVQPA